MDLRSIIPHRRSAPANVEHSDNPFVAMRNEMDRLFDGFSSVFGSEPFPPNGTLAPKVNVAETEKGLEITADLPGVSKDDVDLKLADGVLTLSASTKSEKEEKDEDKRYYRIERSSGSYMRQFAMPFEVDEDHIKADLAEGVLKVTVPRSPNAKEAAKTIPVGD